MGSVEMHKGDVGCEGGTYLSKAGVSKRLRKCCWKEEEEDGAEERCRSRTSRGDDVSSKPTAAAAAGWRRP